MIDPSIRTSIANLFQEFLASYPATEDGVWHQGVYATTRQTGRDNFTSVLEAQAAGKEITNLVLLKLLPYNDNILTREIGAWIHYAPSIVGDVRKWYESKRWVRAEDWPKVAQAILDFAKRCNDEPAALQAACRDFAALRNVKGFQAGMLSPILNALRPDEFTLINAKSRAVVNYLAGKKYSSDLTDYPKLNATALEVVAELDELLSSAGLDLPPADVFDMFCHWLVAVKGFVLKTQCWKIAPGEDAWQWDECREGGFIAMGWDELGDLSELSRADFVKRRDEIAGQQDQIEKALEEVWTFARVIKEGDYIVANRGTKEVLGIGIVTGPYYFEPDVKQGHRLPVEWTDTRRRKVTQYGWTQTLRKVQAKTFAGIRDASTADSSLAEPFSEIFADREEAEWAFGFLRQCMTWLAVEGPDNKLCVLTLPKAHPQVIRFNFGEWVVVDLRGPKAYGDKGISLALLMDGPGLAQYKHWGAFKSFPTALPVAVYELPLKPVREMSEEFAQHVERSFQYIGTLFAKWEQSQFQRVHRQELIDAVFDTQARLFDDDYVVNPECPFSEETFELLAQLDATPTAAFYQEHKEEFVAQVEGPFKRVLQDVAKRLPESIRERMETERRIFAKFLKNDFGQGGAWPWYWGAFYPKGGKRSQDAQLAMWMNFQYLECGFYIGDYGSEPRRRFEANVARHRGQLKEILDETLEGAGLLFGRRDTFTVEEDGTVTQEPRISLEDFLDHPENHYPDVSLVIPAQELLQMSEADLVERVAQTHALLFPLALLAMEDDPLPAIEEYLELPEPDDEPPIQPLYPLAQCAAETGFSQEKLARWVRAIERKKQAIFYGPPGTGKTFMARALARHVVGGGDGFVDLVQFHPAYSYEDFVQGIRPQSINGRLEYPIMAGRFLEFCRQARQRNDACVLIIDEINRANLAQVFGELMYLLEYRDDEIPLAGGSRRFSIPKNVYIIGAMNTADRSIALVDHALRRRFAFLALDPDYDVLRGFHARHATGFAVGGLIEMLKRLNREIGDKHYAIGISFFLHERLQEYIEDIWRMEIEPYLAEYFFDNPHKAAEFAWEKVAEGILPKGQTA